MRQRYLVTYDICDAKRLRAVFRTLKGFGSHLQLSVFRCDLSEVDLIRLRAALTEIIHFSDDSVLIVDVGPADGRGAMAFESLGRGRPMPGVGPRVI
jgi:CRISPR-associated protein Cas2